MWDWRWSCGVLGLKLRLSDLVASPINHLVNLWPSSLILFPPFVLSVGDGMQGLMHTFSLAMFCKLIVCGQSLGSAMVHSAWRAVVHLCFRMFSTSFLWMKYWSALQTPGFISSGLACIMLLGLWMPKVPCVGEVTPSLSHGFMSRFGRKCLPMLLYTWTGAYGGLWFLYILARHLPSSAVFITDHPGIFNAHLSYSVCYADYQPGRVNQWWLHPL